MKFNIKLKLIAGFFTVIVLLLAVSIVGYFSMNSINAGANSVYDQGIVPNRHLATIDATMKQIRGDVYKFIMTPDERDAWEKNTLAGFQTVNSEIAAYHAIVDAENQQSAANITIQKELTSIEQNWATYQSEVKKIFAAGKAGNEEEAQRLMANGSAVVLARTGLVASVTNLQDTQTREVENIRQECQNTFSSSTIITWILAGMSVLLAVIIAFILIRSITGPISKVKSALQKMAKGDLTEKVENKSRDEIGEMVRYYNETQTGLNQLVVQLKDNARQLSQASDQLAIAARQSGESTQQVAVSSQQMAKGAQEQSGSAQDTAQSIKQLSDVINQLAKGATEQSVGVQKAVASITEVSSTMSQVAQNANLATQGAKQAAESAFTGAEKSRKTLSGMEKIKTSAMEVSGKIEELGARSTEIGKIVAVIDDIAAQTNLLALNAAIEAARAGEQGRGFAVVSDEVRKLAERTATATKEIADLICSVQKGVNEATQVMAGGSAAVSEGYNLAVEAGAALEQIMKTSADVNTQVEQISAKTQQVNAATIELVKVIDSVGSITEENTAATEEMSASANEVNKAVETVAGIAEENSAATEEVSASAQEMSAQVEEIVASSQTLKDMAVTLEQSVAKFVVKVE
jgi:methyl-accepting chemotaxis protein